MSKAGPGKIGEGTGYAFLAAFVGFLIFFYGGLTILAGDQGPEDLPWIYMGFFLMVVFSTLQWLSWRRYDQSLSSKPKVLERVRLRRRFFLYLVLGGICLLTAFTKYFFGLLLILPVVISVIAIRVAINAARESLERARAEDARQSSIHESAEDNGGPGAI